MAAKAPVNSRVTFIKQHAYTGLYAKDRVKINLEIEILKIRLARLALPAIYDPPYG